MMLFLNFDGVLHPNNVALSLTKSPTLLKTPGHRLFESNDALEQVLADFPNMGLTLNTWWTYVRGIDECLAHLPKALSIRVKGTVLPHKTLCTTTPNRISLATNVALGTNVPVFIVDHADSRYPKSVLHMALLLDPMQGLADRYAVRALHRFLHRAEQIDNARKLNA